MTTDIVLSEQFQALVDECKAIITETIFNHRDVLIQGYHTLGKTVATNEAYQKYAKDNKSSLQDLAKTVGISPRTLYYCVQVYEKYPDTSLLPEGKNLSWSKLITKYLPKHIEIDGVKSKPSYSDLCEIIKDIKFLLETEWGRAHQEVMRTDTTATELTIANTKCEFIRYLQDQVEKIIRGVVWDG